MIHKKSHTIVSLLLFSCIVQTPLFFIEAQADSLIGSIKNVSSNLKEIKDQWKLIPDKGLQLKVKEGEPVTLSEIPGFNTIALPQSLANIFSSLKITELRVFGSKKLLDIQGTSTMFGDPIYLHIRIAKKELTEKEKKDEIEAINEQITTVTEQTFEEYYAVLGLITPPPATQSEVKKAYRTLALKWHPDKAPSPDLVDEYKAKMQEINEAHAQIMDAIKKGLLPEEGQKIADTTATESQRIADTTSAPLAIEGPPNEEDQKVADTTATESQRIADTTSAPLAIEGPPNTEPASSYDWSFLIDIPKTFQLTKISEVFKPVDFEVRQGTFALSTVKFEDEKAGTIEAGLTFAGQFIAHGVLENMLDMVGSNLNEITLKGLITPKLTGSYLKTTIPGRLKFSDKAETTGLTLGIRVIETAPGVKAGELLMDTGLQVRFPGQTPVVFGVEIAAGPTEASLTGSMSGTILIPNTTLYISNVAVKSTINYAAAAASGGLLSISGLGFGGTLGIGSRRIDLALYMAVNALLASGEFTGGLYLKDIVTLFNNKKLDKEFVEALPNIGIDRVKVEVASQDIIFNNTPYETGGLFEGEGVILDSKVKLRAHFTPKKLKVSGYMEPVTIGPLTITGAGKDGIMGTEDDGAYLDITVDPTASTLPDIFRGIIDGKVIFVFGADTSSAYTRIELQPDKAIILFELLLANLFTTKLDAKIDLANPKKSHIDLLMEQSALDKLSVLLKTTANDILESYGTKARRAVEIRRRACKGLTPFLETKPYLLAHDAAQAAVRAEPNGESQALQAFAKFLEENKDAMLERIIPTLPAGDAIEYAWELLVINIPTLEDLINFYKENPKQMEIIWAATATNKEWGKARVEELLSQGTPIDTEDMQGRSLLMLAVQSSNDPLVEILLKHKADPNKALEDGTTILMYALQSPSITKKLIAAGAEVNAQDAEGKTVLDYAIEKSHPEAFAALVTAGAGGGKTEIVKLLTQEFAKALQGNDADRIQNITATGYFDVLARDAAGRTAVIQAIQDVSDTNVRPAIVTTLLLVDGNIHDLANLTDTAGVTPLVHAIQKNDSNTVDRLLQYGADPRHKIKEKTPLEYAQETQNKEIIAAISTALEKTPQPKTILASKKTRELREKLEEQRQYIKTHKTTQTPNPLRNALSNATPQDINFVGDGVAPLLITAIDNEDYTAVKDLLEFKADPNIVWQETSALTHALNKKASIKQGYPTTNIDRIIQNLKDAGAVE